MTQIGEYKLSKTLRDQEFIENVAYFADIFCKIKRYQPRNTRKTKYNTAQNSMNGLDSELSIWKRVI